jgi:murein DD-endopeptidase MepM/ murein hydrolase activator NlpD
MKFWPVPNSYEKILPEKGASGSFWEDRGDRRHCGVDIYAPEGSPVHAVEEGIVIRTSVFTSREMVAYWNTTYAVLIKQVDGFLSRYAELGHVRVSKGDRVKAGQIIGVVGSVLNLQAVSEDAPLYIRLLKENGRSCMLHFEVFRAEPDLDHLYSGGNLFSSSRPDCLLDAAGYLTGQP